MTKTQENAMIRTTLLAALIFAPALAMAQEPSIYGNWARGDGQAKVVIKDCGSNICAVNTWIKPGTKSEKAGDTLVMTLKKTDATSYEGKAFDPQRDMSYKMKLSVGEQSMTTRGCVFAGILCKSISWSRL
jgi:uncharacterized protein (DUF2147 family)